MTMIRLSHAQLEVLHELHNQYKGWHFRLIPLADNMVMVKVGLTDQENTRMTPTVWLVDDDGYQWSRPWPDGSGR